MTARRIVTLAARAGPSPCAAACASGRAAAGAGRRRAAGLRPGRRAAYSKVVAGASRQPRGASTGLERAKLRASNAHFARGRRLCGAGALRGRRAGAAAGQRTEPDECRRRAAICATCASPCARSSPRPENGPDGARVAARTDARPGRRGLRPAGRAADRADLDRPAGDEPATVYLTVARLANLRVTFDPRFATCRRRSACCSDMTVTPGARRDGRRHQHVLSGHRPPTIVIVAGHAGQAAGVHRRGRAAVHRAERGPQGDDGRAAGRARRPQHLADHAAPTRFSCAIRRSGCRSSAGSWARSTRPGPRSSSTSRCSR